MTCREVREQLAAHLADAVSTRLAARLDQHLAECPACRAERDGLVGVEAVLAQLAEPGPGTDLWPGLAARLEAAEAAEARRQPRRWGLPALAGAAAALALATVLLRQPAEQPDQSAFLRDHYRVAGTGAFGNAAVGDVLAALAEEDRR